MIELDKIGKMYEGKKAVKDLSVKIMEGELCVLIGPSGCGKTTTLKMINRMIEPSAGNIYIDDNNIKKMKVERLRRSIGYVIQSIGLFPHMTVAENIATVPKLLNWKKHRINERTEELLNLLNLEPESYSNKYPKQLSGGEAQRVGIARALAANPSILLMDEPFGAVDPITRENLQYELVRIQTELKKSIIFVTHDIDEAIRLADKILIMKEGELVQYDTPENILTKPKNKFVMEFIGTDRALKRLSRIEINDSIRKCLPYNLNTKVKEVIDILKKDKYVWVTDDNDKILGWVDQNDVRDEDGIIDKESLLEEYMISIKIGENTLRDNCTVKDAVSRMVWQGMKCLPIIDREGVLLGEICMNDVLDL